jgi:hypothetical protein
MAVSREGTQGRTICEGYRMGPGARFESMQRPPCETRYSTTGLLVGECGQILETLKGQPPSYCKLQIRP